MKCILRVPGPTRVECNTSPENIEVAIKTGQPVYHKLVAFGGEVRFPADKAIRVGDYGDAELTVEVSGMASTSTWEGQSRSRIVQQVKVEGLHKIEPKK